MGLQGRLASADLPEIPAGGQAATAPLASVREFQQATSHSDGLHQTILLNEKRNGVERTRSCQEMDQSCDRNELNNKKKNMAVIEIDIAPRKYYHPRRVQYKGSSQKLMINFDKIMGTKTNYCTKALGKPIFTLFLIPQTLPNKNDAEVGELYTNSILGTG